MRTHKGTKTTIRTTNGGLDLVAKGFDTRRHRVGKITDGVDAVVVDVDVSVTIVPKMKDWLFLSSVVLWVRGRGGTNKRRTSVAVVVVGLCVYRD